MADIKVYGTIRTMATDGIVATADQLKDTNVGKFQEVINQELAGGMEGKQDTIADLEQIRSLANSAVQPSVLQAAIADFITKSVDDLVNYYKKSETYTKAEVNGLIGAIKQFTYRVASSLPTASESTMYIIYLIPSSNASTQNVKDEFITIQDGSSYSWEQIGSTKIDLSGYSTTEEMNAAITSALNTALSDYYDKAGVDELLSNYAHKDGFYETLGAGTALNLQGNTSKDATFTYRTAGGTEDIASGLATIHSIKGNTVVWNQLIKSKYRNAEMTLQEDVSLYCTDFPRFESGYRHTLYVNHKYYTKAKIAYTTQKEYSYATIQLRHTAQGANYNVANTNQSSSIFTCNADTQTVGIRFMVLSTAQEAPRFLAGDTLSYSDLMLIDLTLMFGASNEPSTVEEFEEWLTNNVGLQDYYEYSEPTMLSADANSLETVGFNQWDGSYSKEGYYLNSDGTSSSSSSYAISNFIPVFGNTDYFINKTSDTNPSVCFYDKDKKYIDGIKYNGATSKLFTTPTNAAYLKFTVRKANKNITNLNLSWSGIRNGEYEDYWKRSYPINVSQLTSNGTVIFPNGMNRVGNVYDEIVSVDGVTKAIKRIGSVDLGTLNWTAHTSADNCIFFKTVSTVVNNSAVRIAVSKSTTDEFIINKSYTWYGWLHQKYNLATHDKSIAFNSTNDSSGTVAIYDSAYADTTAFKNAMNGVVVYFQLATPIEYEIDNFEMPLAYKVDDFGTEETKKDTFALSPTFAITYGVNAVDTLRRLPTNYISKESMQNFLNALGVQMGGTWTMTLDNNEYKFSFVANPEATTNDDGV